MNLTSRAQRSIYEPGIEFADPVLNTPSATEGQNNHTVGGVYSNEASDAAYSSTISIAWVRSEFVVQEPREISPTHFRNEYHVTAWACSTLGQFPAGQAISVPG